MTYGYDYQTEKKDLFTEEGQVFFLDVRDRVKGLLKIAGAFREMELKPAAGAYSCWTLMAALDRLVELGELVVVRDQCWRQYRVYSTPEIDNR